MNFVPSVNNDEEVNNVDLLFQRIRSIMEGSASDFKAYSQYPAVLLIDASPNVVESYMTNRVGEASSLLPLYLTYLFLVPQTIGQIQVF
jgi:hypothetical protein